MVVTHSLSSTLPRMGLGMAALGRPGYINLDRNEIFGSPDARSIETMQRKADEVMDTLFQITNSGSTETKLLPWLDCARSYGLSEKFVGEYLCKNKVAPKDCYVSSKWGYTYVADFKVKLDSGASHEVKDHSTSNFLKQLKETNELIGEYVDLYQIHSATFDSGILANSEAHQALAQCRKERGWAIGLSVSSPLQGQILQEAMAIRVDGDVRLFDSVQCTYNVLEQRPGPYLLKAHQAGMDIIIKEGLANGRALRHPQIVKYAKDLACETDQLALACILSQPFQPRVLSGAVTPAQLESNLKALDLAKRLAEDSNLLSEIMSACCVNSEIYWAERSALGWN